MPFTGGYSPSPERAGGGDGTGNAPLLQRVFESIAAARGVPYDQTLNSAVGAENLALARAITFDLYGSNTRFTNEMNPTLATVAGLLPRWEKILGCAPMFGDTQPVRQARVAAALARFGQTNASQHVIDVLSACLGGLFVGLTLFTPSNALVWWPAYGGSAAYVASVSGNLVTVDGLTSVPTAAPGANLVLSNITNIGNLGTFPIKSRISSTSVVIVNDAGHAPDYGVGGTSGAPTVEWTMPNPAAPWVSTVAHIDVLVSPTGAPGFVTPAGMPNGLFFQAMNRMNPILDALVPADVTFDWYAYSSLGAIGFVLDDPNNLDVEVMDV